MRTATSVNTKRLRRGDSADEVSLLAIGLSFAGVILLATKVYFVSELLVLLVALAVLFSLGTGVLILVVLVQESGRWSVRKIIEAKQRALLSRGALGFRS